MTDKTHRPVNPNRRKFLKDASLIPAGLYLGASAAGASAQGSSPQSGAGETMMDYAAPALDTVRVGVIGAGRRGTCPFDIFIPDTDGARPVFKRSPGPVEDRRERLCM